MLVMIEAESTGGVMAILTVWELGAAPAVTDATYKFVRDILGIEIDEGPSVVA